MRKPFIFRFYFCAITLSLFFFACTSSAGKQSAVEGQLLDWNGKPIDGVKIVATQTQPIKGYEKLEAITDQNGSFIIKGLFPSNQYILKPWSDKWSCDTVETFTSAPQGEIAVLPSPMIVNLAFSLNDNRLVSDLKTGEYRFNLSSNGVITDSETGLEWIIGPDRDTNYSEAVQWVADCKVAGNGWRIPNRQELKTLYVESSKDLKMDSSFNMSGWYVWAEPRSSRYSYGFYFNGMGSGKEDHRKNKSSFRARVFGVRSNSQ
jgi:hypothetical protein